MSVQNGNPANQTTFNTSFMSREEDTNTIGRVDLDNGLAESGPAVSNVQRELNGQASFVGDTPEGAYDRKPTWTSDSIGSPNQTVKDRVDSVQAAVEGNQAAITGLQGDVTDIRSALGIVDGDTDMGTYTGTTISDNVDQATINQELETAVEARIPLSEKGAANGVATLDSGGRLPVGQLPTSAVEYKGAWNASTNTPILIDGTGDNGDLYRVSVAGTQDLGSGSVSYGVGDAIIYNGTIWQRIPSDSAVESVNGQSGIVVLDTDDVAEGVSNLYHTNARVDARIALASINDLADVDTTTTPPNTNEALVWDGTNWVPGEAVGGSGQGKKNYFEGGDFEQDISLASVYDDGGSFVDGTGGTPSAITISHNSTGPLAGAFDLEIYKTTVSGIGEGVTLLSSNIDTIDLGKDLFLELSINATDTNYTSGNYVLCAYDITNNAIIPVVPIANLGDNGEILKAQTTIYAKILCNSTTTQVRVSLHCNADPVPGNDFFVWVDQAVLSPSSVLVGSIITEWQSYTPTLNSLTNVAINEAKYRRVGDSVHVMAVVQYSGTGAASEFTLSIPSGLTTDTTKINSTVEARTNFGQWGWYDDSGSVPSRGGFVQYASATTVKLRRNDDSNTAQSSSFAANDRVNLNFTVPVVEWSAGNLLSANEAAITTAKLIAFRDASPQNLTNNADTTLIFNTIREQSGGSNYNTSTGVYTCPRRGWYFARSQVYTDAFSASSTFVLQIRQNGNDRGTVRETTNTTSNPRNIEASALMYCQAGDTITSVVFQNTGATRTAINGIGLTNFMIMEQPDFSVFGVYGEAEYYRITPASDVSTVSADTYVDQPGASLTLNPGVWQIGYDAAVFVQRISGTSVGLVTSCAIRNSSNVVQPGTVGMIYSIQSNADDWRVSSISRTSFVTITTPTTFKLSVRCSNAAASGVATIIGDTGFTSSLTNPDNNTNLWARRIR